MKSIEKIYDSSDITGLIPGVRGQRAFPTMAFKNSDPFLMLDHIGPQKVGASWELSGEGHDHPHRGFETITFMFEGKMNHRDSLGNRAILTSGSVQRMNAGAGIIHGGSMFADAETHRFHEMQLWVNSPKLMKMSQPNVHNVTNDLIPTLKQNDIKLRVIAGELNGLGGPIETLASTQIGHTIAEKDGQLTVSTFSPETKVMIYALEGEVVVGNTRIEAFQLAKLSELGDELTLQMSAGARALILAGVPINEPVVFGGPFVMNTEDEIYQANMEYQQGEFGAIPQLP